MRSVRGLLVKLLVALVVAALAAVLLVKFRDASLQHKLTGTWVSTNGTNAWSTSTIAGDGRFTAEIHDTNGHVLTLEGTEKVEFGYLRLPAGPKLGFLVAETDTKRDGTNVIPPCVSHDYIIRLTDQEYVENPEYYATNVTFKKVSQ